MTLKSSMTKVISPVLYGSLINDTEIVAASVKIKIKHT